MLAHDLGAMRVVGSGEELDGVMTLCDLFEGKERAEVPGVKQALARCGNARVEKACLSATAYLPMNPRQLTEYGLRLLVAAIVGECVAFDVEYGQ